MASTVLARMTGVRELTRGRGRPYGLSQYEGDQMSRLGETQARLDAALQRLDAALRTLEIPTLSATEPRDRQIAALTAELAALRQERDALGLVADQAAGRIDAVIDRLRVSLAN
jgi:hypothetical protein